VPCTVVYSRECDLGDLPEALARRGIAVRPAGPDDGLDGRTILIAPPGDPLLATVRDRAGVVAVIHPPVTEVALEAALRSAAGVENAQALEIELRDLLDVARSLSSQRDVRALQGAIVRTARELTDADAGTLYILDPSQSGEPVLRFSVAQEGNEDIGELLDTPLPLDTQSIAGYVALTGQTVRLEDAYAIPESAPYRFTRRLDDTKHYRTKSQICVAMKNVAGDVIGVIQLINRKPSFDLEITSREQTERVVLPFGDRDEELLTALASQAAVAMENARLVASIQNLFEHFVRASVKAIEVRDKSTEGHSERVAALTVAQAEAVNAIEAGPLADLRFSVEQVREMRYAALLHDFGKVGVPEYIFGKSRKLPEGQLEAIRMRFLLAVEQSADQRERTELLALLAKIEAADQPNIVSAQNDGAFADALERRYRDVRETRPLLLPHEYEYLTIPRGSLTEDERARMQDHVTQSYYFLREIPWIQTPWKGVADLAYGHHEHLDGGGYPRGLRGDQIPPQVRMMTISDVFDALTAADRPYKKALSAERALDILGKEFADRGKIDRTLLDVFIAKRLYAGISG
jgi:HD-GYP domain-containing protein (c-di-GMP phosphodiesterase class II)